MFDAVALSAVVDELHKNILHGRVQEIIPLDELAIGFEIYAQKARQYLYASAQSNDARVHLMGQKIRGSGASPSPLVFLLRKYAENAFIDSITQLPQERVLQIRFDHSVEGASTLVIETIGRYSNLILLNPDGLVLDALKRVGSDINRVRVILPGQKYNPPPAQSKITPSSLTVSSLQRLLSGDSGTQVWQVLVKTIAGVSPLLAREIAFRVQGKTDATCDPARAGDLLTTLQSLLHAPWQPTIAFEEGEPAAFAPYRLTQFTDVRPVDSISAAIEVFFGTPESYAAAKQLLRTEITDARDTLARKRDALARSLPPESEIKRLRMSGELILGYASRIEPGQTILHAETESGMIEIPLDSKQSAIENAQEYFRQYRRLQQAAARVPALLAAANADLDYAEQLLTDLEFAENRDEIDTVIATATEAGFLREKRQKAKVKPSTPRVFSSRDGFSILIGKNALQNEEITFRRAQANDLWLHARGVAGAHTVIVRAGRDIPQSTIVEAAELAAYYSQSRDDSRVDVIVTLRRNVHRVRGAKPGTVTVHDERVVAVVPRKQVS